MQQPLHSPSSQQASVVGRQHLPLQGGLPPPWTCSSSSMNSSRMVGSLHSWAPECPRSGRRNVRSPAAAVKAATDPRNGRLALLRVTTAVARRLLLAARQRRREAALTRALRRPATTTHLLKLLDEQLTHSSSLLVELSRPIPSRTGRESTGTPRFGQGRSRYAPLHLAPARRLTGTRVAVGFRWSGREGGEPARLGRARRGSGRRRAMLGDRRARPARRSPTRAPAIQPPAGLVGTALAGGVVGRAGGRSDRSLPGDRPGAGSG